MNKSAGITGSHQRTTEWVGQKGAQTLYYAEQQAARIGYPLNWSITINFSQIGIAPRDAGRAFAKIRSQRFAPWVRRPSRAAQVHSAPPTYSYGFENCRGGQALGINGGDHNVHVHWAVHVPLQRQRHLEEMLHRWMTQIAGDPDWPIEALHLAPITRTGATARYPTKGARPETAKHFGVPEEKIAPQGIIIGQRTGTSRNIGPSARISLDRKLGISRKANRYRGQQKP
jgi:hypothetical protein